MDNFTSTCLTRTIDGTSTVGDRYYHNLENNIVRMRPRIPLRFDFNDVSIVQMPENEATNLKRNYVRIDPNRATIRKGIYRLKRTNLSIVNTFLLYFLAMLLIFTSLINMRKTITVLQEDTSLTNQERMNFRVGFILSFVVVMILSCYVVLSLYELYRNFDKFPTTFVRNNIQYKSLLFPDGNYLSLRWFILFFSLICILLSIAEVFNLFFMEMQPALLIIIVPILMVCLLIVSFFTLSTNP